MKNIHVLPTEKSSRIRIGNNGNFVFGLMQNSITSKNDSYTNQNIYITSDEEIKKEDWVYNLKYSNVRKIFLSVNGINSIQKEDRKIILTDNQDLIKDGVQAIDDEFLEWFVKNPSCESVKFWRFHGINTSIAEVNAISGDGSLNWQGRGDLRDYKIIIPQEGMNCWSGKKGVEGWPSKEEPKQETLEEVRKVERTELFNSIFSVVKQIPRKDVDGDAMDAPSCAYEIEQLFYKWQQEQDKNKYSEEDLREAFIEGYKQRAEKSDLIFDNASRMYAIALFEQFKIK